MNHQQLTLLELETEPTPVKVNLAGRPAKYVVTNACRTLSSAQISQLRCYMRALRRDKAAAALFNPDHLSGVLAVLEKQN